MKNLSRYASLICTMAAAPPYAEPATGEPTLTPEEQAQLDNYIQHLDTLDLKKIETMSEAELGEGTIFKELFGSDVSFQKRSAIFEMIKSHPVVLTKELRGLELSLLPSPPITKSTVFRRLLENCDIQLKQKGVSTDYQKKVLALYEKKAIDPKPIEKKFLQWLNTFDAKKIKAMNTEEIIQFMQNIEDKLDALTAGNEEFIFVVLTENRGHPVLATAVAREFELRETKSSREKQGLESVRTLLQKKGHSTEYIDKVLKLYE